MLSAMAPHGREMSQDLRKKIISLHKKGEGYKKISKALLISQNTVAKVVQTFKKDGTATISQRRPGRPRNLTPRQERLLMRRVEENRHASSLQLSKEVESQTGVTISRDTIRRTLQSQVTFKSSHLYLYSAFNNTNCNKALHNIKIGKFCQ